MEVPKNFVGQRFDRYLMTQYKLPWDAAQKMIRSKLAFVVLRKEEWGEEESKNFVHRKGDYVL
jgi:hypothetical protein